MNYTFSNNGIDTSVYYSEDNIKDIFLPLLKRMSDLRKSKDKRILVMLAAPPGAGKSTLCSFLKYQKS